MGGVTGFVKSLYADSVFHIYIMASWNAKDGVGQFENGKNE
jgi:hypothetical protein